MKIGIDAWWLSEKLTGIGRYTEELTKRFVTKKAFFVLYSAHPIVSMQWSRKNITLKSKQMYGRIMRLLWSQTYLMYWAWQDKLDLFWGPAHRLPWLLPKKMVRIVTIHDLVWKKAGHTMPHFRLLLERFFMPRAVQMADLIIADSQHTAKDLAAEFPEIKARIRVIYPSAGAMPSPLDFQSLAHFNVTKPYILFVGTLEPRKNLKCLLKAFSCLPIHLKETYQLVIAGSKGWGNEDVQALSESLNIEDKVVITGYVSDVQLSTLYAHAYMLAMPSLYEGFGLPILEANAFGVPVLTSNCSSMPEVAGDAAILIDPYDVSAVSAGLCTLLSSQSTRNELALKARGNAKRFSWDKAASETWAVFEEAIKIRKSKLEVE